MYCDSSHVFCISLSLWNWQRQVLGQWHYPAWPCKPRQRRKLIGWGDDAGRFAMSELPRKEETAGESAGLLWPSMWPLIYCRSSQGAELQEVPRDLLCGLTFSTSKSKINHFDFPILIQRSSHSRSCIVAPASSYPSTATIIPSDSHPFFFVCAFFWYFMTVLTFEPQKELFETN
jgi:hypothetical protein